MHEGDSGEQCQLRNRESLRSFGLPGTMVPGYVGVTIIDIESSKEPPLTGCILSHR